MALLNRLKEVVGEESGPNRYECPECGREYEVDAPPDRVICTSCGNEDVTLLEEG